jgi:replicative DNA helicase
MTALSPAATEELCAFEAEQAAVGAILEPPKPDTRLEAMARVPPDAFWVNEHQELVRCVYDLYRADPRAPIDQVRVLTWLRENQSTIPQWAVAELIARAAVGHDAAVHSFDIVARYAAARRLRDDCLTAARIAVTKVADPTQARSSALALVAGSGSGPTAEAFFGRPFDVVGAAAMEEMTLRAMPDSFAGAVSTGLLDLDESLTGRGHFPGQVVAIGARTRTGKTVLAGQMAATYAAQARTQGLGTVAYYSMEMPATEMWFRIAAGYLRINHRKIVEANIDDAQWAQMERWLADFPNQHLWIFDKPPYTVEAVTAYCERQIAMTGNPPCAIFLDHLGLLKVAALGGRASEYDHASESIKMLKQIALAYSTRIVVTVQINRKVDARVDPRPTLSDFRQTGEIEQSADIALLLHREELYNPDTDDRGIIEIDLAKQRSGSQGTIRAAFLGQYQCIANMARG